MESAVDELQSVKLKTQHLSNVANLLAEKSPELGKVYGKKLQDLLNSSSPHQDRNAVDSIMCPFCGVLYLPDNHTRRIRPRMRCTKQIKRLDRKQNQEGANLGKFKARILDMFTQSTADTVILCHSCNRRNVIHGQSREDKLKTKEKLLLLTPEPSIVKKKKRKRKSDCSLLDSTSSSLDTSLSAQTLTSTPKATLFTPAWPSPKTQSSSTSSASFTSPAASSGSASKKSKKAFHSQLKSMLNKNKGNGSSPKTSLKDFLSSL